VRPRESRNASGLAKYKGARLNHGSNGSGRKIAMLTATLIVAVAAGGTLLYLSKRSRVVIASETLCPTDRPVAELDVVLLDVSDELTDVQILSIKNHLKRLQDRVPKFARIEAYTLAEAARPEPKSFVQICNPGNGEEMNRLYQNPELARRRWEVGFASRLNDEMNRLLKAPPDPESPIFEAIQTTAVRVLNKPEFDHVQKRLVIFSDLLQNVSGKQSHYTTIPNFDLFKATDYFVQVRTDLSGLDVRLFYITRARVTTQGAAHIAFWDKYFGAQGAVVSSVHRIEGGR
jgi:hypothetical protein